MNYDRNNEKAPIRIDGKLVNLTRSEYIEVMRLKRDEENRKFNEQLAESLRPKTLSELADMPPEQRWIMSFGSGHEVTSYPRTDTEKQRVRLDWIEKKVETANTFRTLKSVLEIMNDYQSADQFRNDVEAWVEETEAMEAFHAAFLPEENDQAGWATANGQIQPPTFPECPIRYSVNCLQDLKEWLGNQDQAFGCQYYLTQPELMTALSQVKNCELVIHEQEWWAGNFTKPWHQKTWDSLCENYPQITSEESCGIYVLPIGQTGKLMHQKWIIGERILDADSRINYAYWEHNLACGSFNLTANASMGLESMFFIDNVNSLKNTDASWEKSRSAVEAIWNMKFDFEYLKHRSQPWEVYRQNIGK